MMKSSVDRIVEKVDDEGVFPRIEFDFHWSPLSHSRGDVEDYDRSSLSVGLSDSMLAGR